ncbi:asparagine synthase-related protein [Streptomyces megasporus]|uniref:asparagine synthase-related protein n=1 Tax=Streptomyces megasporus TaxID=44060 RepID=UPI00068F3A3B|nr:asparagine synthase-related protein [Streptomyces megasporus]
MCAWLTPQARRHIALRAAEAAEIAEEAEVPAEEVSRHCARSELYEYGVYEAELRNQSHAMGLPHHAPFLDNQVVRAAMAVSVREHASLTVQKPLLGAALDGLVPFWLLARRTKGSYSGNACTGIRRHAAELRELITGGRLTAEGWLDGDAALRELERLAVGVPGRFAALEAVIAAELWIRQQREETPHGTS